MKLKYISTVLFASLCIITGCSDFEQVNTDQNKTSVVSSAMLATGMLKSMAQMDNGQHAAWLYSYIAAHYVANADDAASYDYNEMPEQGFDDLAPLRNAQKMIDYATTDELKASYEGLAHFMRAYHFFRLTMLVGDMPYSESFQAAEGITAPKYDTQKDIFVGLLNELDQAYDLFGKGAKFDGDILYGGDVKKWQKAANALQLRILINLYKKTDADLDVKGRFAKVLQRSNFESNSDNLQLVYSDKKGQEHPHYINVSKFTMYDAMTDLMVDKLKELDDWRLFSYASPAQKLLNEGKAESDWDAYAGVDYTIDYSTKNALCLSEYAISGLNEHYEQVAQGDPAAMLTYAENQFTLAEAALRGLVSGDAEQYYYAGIKASMENTAKNAKGFEHGRVMDDAYINSYIASDKVKLSGSVDNKIEQVLWQKYIAGFLQSPWNAYFQIRRTDVPKIKINPATNCNNPNDRYPLRRMYSGTERSYNKENLEEAIQRQFGGNETTVSEIWILK